jgi:calpain-15
LNFIKHEPFLNQHIDKEFPPTNFSLYINGNRIARKTLIHSSGFKQVKVWLRAQNINCGKEDQKYPITLFNNPTPKDVIQGELGTCWFLSALSLVSEKPILILNLMLTKQFNPDGLHQIRLCRRGEWKIISIDDYLPCDKHNQLVFSYGRKRQFWVPLYDFELYASFCVQFFM